MIEGGANARIRSGPVTKSLASTPFGKKPSTESMVNASGRSISHSHRRPENHLSFIPRRASRMLDHLKRGFRQALFLKTS